VLVWFSGALQDEPPNEPNYKAGLLAMCAAYLAYSALQGPSSVMIRPHPMVWRLVHGCGMVYLLCLVFLLMQGKDEARRLLSV
jgi:phosphatidylserine synthase 2